MKRTGLNPGAVADLFIGGGSMKQRLRALAASIMRNSETLAGLAVSWAEIAQEMVDISEGMDGEDEDVLGVLDGSNPLHREYIVQAMEKFPNAKGGIDSKRFLEAVKVGKFPKPPK